MGESQIHYIVNGKNQPQKATYCMIPFIGHSGKGKTIRHGEGISSCQRLGPGVGTNGNCRGWRGE